MIIDIVLSPSLNLNEHKFQPKTEDDRKTPGSKLHIN